MRDYGVGGSKGGNRMTLEEAIIHAKEVADYQEHDAMLWDR